MGSYRAKKVGFLNDTTHEKAYIFTWTVLLYGRADQILEILTLWLLTSSWLRFGYNVNISMFGEHTSKQKQFIHIARFRNESKVTGPCRAWKWQRIPWRAGCAGRHRRENKPSVCHSSHSALDRWRRGWKSKGERKATGMLRGRVGTCPCAQHRGRTKAANKLFSIQWHTHAG